MKTKVCSKCKVEKTIDCFTKNKTNKDGLQYACKVCDNIYYKKWYSKNKKYHSIQMKRWREDNKEYITNYEKNRPNKLERNVQNRLRHQLKKKERLAKQHEYHIKHRNEILKRQMKNREKNGIKYNAQHHIYNKTEKGKQAIVRMNDKRRCNGFGNNEIFPNILDDTEKPVHHHLINKKYFVWMPDDIHRLFYAGRDREKHCENLFSIVEQLYPEIDTKIKRE